MGDSFREALEGERGEATVIDHFSRRRSIGGNAETRFPLIEESKPVPVPPTQFGKWRPSAAARKTAISPRVTG
jgi:hypothetical protein